MMRAGLLMTSATWLLFGCTAPENVPAASEIAQAMPESPQLLPAGGQRVSRTTIAPAPNAESRLAAPADSRLTAAEPEGLQTFTEEEDYDGDGIADTRTIRRFKYDAAGRTCRLVTERDFDADGTIDARTTNLSSYGAVGGCGS